MCSASVAIPYSRKVLRVKTFANFAFLWLFAKVFPVKFGVAASFSAAQASNSRKFFLRKSYFSPIRESFLPWKFPAIWYMWIAIDNPIGKHFYQFKVSICPIWYIKVYLSIAIETVYQRGGCFAVLFRILEGDDHTWNSSCTLNRGLHQTHQTVSLIPRLSQSKEPGCLYVYQVPLLTCILLLYQAIIWYGCVG